ncbi:DUF3099 domain-containing protein [Corynebacterium pacaense]|uniref:DUF3099 domain-containing protein n=1 Tax=Corynebacterium pacaense TaxID=1816684 RepID=UPI0009BC3F5C|nr:DUF3099 domain-containing protein [Corynebacterium pacaense]
MSKRTSHPSGSAGGRKPGGRNALDRLRRIIHPGEVLLITDARRSPGQDLRHRRRVYNVLQALRVPLLLLAGASYVWWHSWFLSTVFIIASVPLPWIAVVIANGHGEPRDPRTPQVYKPALAREMQRREAIDARRTHELEQQGEHGPAEIEVYRDPIDFSGIVIDADDQEENPTDES